MLNKKYEVECQRTNVTPKTFWDYCTKQCEKRGIDIESWSNFENWSKPYAPEEWHRNEYKDWEELLSEEIKMMPFDLKFYLEKCYNCIIEFQFDTKTKGFGYLYLVEYEKGIEN